MRQSVLDLREFYASPLGAVVRRMVGRKVVEAWGDAHALDVLALGYATPFVETLAPAARRTVAAMPAGQGVEAWPAVGANRAFLADDEALSLPNALFDRILAVHALEEADDPLALLREAARVLAPSGRVILVVTARRGLWADAESSPFGHGRPFSRGQLERLVRDADLEPIGWTRALYVPPAPWAARWGDNFEQVGALIWPAFSGLILMEAIKQTFAVRPRAVPSRRRLAPAFGPSPAPVGRSHGRRRPPPESPLGPGGDLVQGLKR